jgi:hypothetical protein
MNYNECLPTDPCQDFAANDPMQCCIQLRGRIELLQAEIRELRYHFAYGVPGEVPGPYESNEEAEAAGVAEWQLYRNSANELFTRIPIIEE